MKILDPKKLVKRLLSEEWEGWDGEEDPNSDDLDPSDLDADGGPESHERIRKPITGRAIWLRDDRSDGSRATYRMVPPYHDKHQNWFFKQLDASTVYARDHKGVETLVFPVDSLSEVFGLRGVGSHAEIFAEMGYKIEGTPTPEGFVYAGEPAAPSRGMRPGRGSRPPANPSDN